MFAQRYLSSESIDDSSASHSPCIATMRNALPAFDFHLSLSNSRERRHASRKRNAKFLYERKNRYWCNLFVCMRNFGMEFNDKSLSLSIDCCSMCKYVVLITWSITWTRQAMSHIHRFGTLGHQAQSGAMCAALAVSIIWNICRRRQRPPNRMRLLAVGSCMRLSCSEVLIKWQRKILTWFGAVPAGPNTHTHTHTKSLFFTTVVRRRRHY